MGGKVKVRVMMNAKYDFWGNKKNLRTTSDGKYIITKEMEAELVETGVIVKEGKKNYLVDVEGNKVSYQVRKSDKDEVSTVFQFHIPRDQWGTTYNLYSEKMEDGGRRKVIFVPAKSRFEIWENPKGGKRKMVKRVDGLDKVTDIVNTWNDTYDSEISIDGLQEAIR
jgi:hypothetical protein